MPTVAERQLAAWQQIAKGWLVDDAMPADDGQLVDRCRACGKGIALAADAYGNLYRYHRDEYLALIVLHLRNHHADLDPN